MKTEDEKLSAGQAQPCVKPLEETTYSQEEFEEAYELGKRDGYEEAVQEIDQKTGGDGEYRHCLGGADPDRHTPDPETMIQRIVDRFETLNLLDEAIKEDPTLGVPPVQVPVVKALTEFRKFVDLIEGRAMACDGPVTPFLEQLNAASDAEKQRFVGILSALYREA